MSDDSSFRDLIRRVRAGDQEAATDLVHSYQPTIRLIVRRRLTDPDMRRLLDSMDVSQSILAGFFARARSGQFELDTPEQLLRLLATMARNKLTSYARRQASARPAGCGVRVRSPEELQVADRAPSPSRIIASKELLEEFRKRLSQQEQQLLDQRAAGRSWCEIAAQIGESPDTVRMRFTRAVAWIARSLEMQS